MAPPKTAGAKRGTIRSAAAHNSINFTIRAAPLPKPIFDFLRDNLVLLRRMQQENSREEGQALSTAGQDDEAEHDETEDADEVDLQGEVLKRPTVKAEEFWPTLEQKCKDAGPEWADVAERVWAFGPQKAGTCLLVDSRPGLPTSFVLSPYFVTAGAHV